MLRPGHAYFANSYRIDQTPHGWTVAMTEHGAPFVSAIERGNVLACQFHPELSGDWGRHLLRRWLQEEGAPGAVAQDEPGTHKLKPRIIPCLDVRNGRVVKGIKFQGLRDAGDPAERAAAYEHQDADELVVLDVAATKENRGARQETVRRVRAELTIPLTVGGGIRDADDAAALLSVGADKVSVNTAAVLRPALVADIATRFGRQCTVVAVDAARTQASTDDAPQWEVVIKGGSQRVGKDAIAWIAEAAELGAGEVLLTSWDRDGTRSGYDLQLLEAAAAAVSIPIIASGGADTAAHMQDALVSGADAVLAASIFHDGHTTVQQVKMELEALGIETR